MTGARDRVDEHRLPWKRNPYRLGRGECKRCGGEMLLTASPSALEALKTSWVCSTCNDYGVVLDEDVALVLTSYQDGTSASPRLTTTCIVTGKHSMASGNVRPQSIDDTPRLGHRLGGAPPAAGRVSR